MEVHPQGTVMKFCLQSLGLVVLFGKDFKKSFWVDWLFFRLIS